MSHNNAVSASSREERFAEAYLLCGNAEEAALRAGYRETSGAGLLRRASVKAYLQARQEDLRRKNIADADEVLTFLTRVMRGEIEGEKALGTAPRMKAAEMLNKRYEAMSGNGGGGGGGAVVIVDDLSN